MWINLYILRSMTPSNVLFSEKNKSKDIHVQKKIRLLINSTWSGKNYQVPGFSNRFN